MHLTSLRLKGCRCSCDLIGKTNIEAYINSVWLPNITIIFSHLFRELLKNECLPWLREVTGMKLNDNISMTCSKYDYTGQSSLYYYPPLPHTYVRTHAHMHAHTNVCGTLEQSALVIIIVMIHSEIRSSMYAVCMYV